LKRLKKISRSASGITLLELIITFSIFSLIVVGIIGFYRLTRKSQRVAQGYYKASQDTELLLHILAEKIKFTPGGAIRISEDGNSLQVAENLFFFKENLDTQHITDDYKLFFDPDFKDTEPPKLLSNGMKKVLEKNFFKLVKKPGETDEEKIMRERWVSLPELPQPRACMPSVYYQKNIFLFGGTKNSYEAYDDVLRYDIEKATWSNKGLNDLPIEKLPLPLRLIGAVLVENEVWLFGGDNSSAGIWGSPQSIVCKYNLETNTWAYDENFEGLLKPLPFPVYGAGVAYFDGKIYVFGGCTSQWPEGSNLVQEYDITNNSWQVDTEHGGVLAPLPIATSIIQAFPLYEQIYIIGGLKDRDESYAKLQIYNPKTNTWEIHDMPEGSGSYLYSGVAYGSEIFIIGGCNTSWGSATEVMHICRVFLKEEAEEPVWEEEWYCGIPLPEVISKYGGSATVSPEGVVYLIGGYTGGSDSIPAVQAHNINPQKTIRVRYSLIENLEALERHLKHGHKGPTPAPTPQLTIDAKISTHGF
jgi:hypothetical protein